MWVGNYRMINAVPCSFAVAYAIGFGYYPFRARVGMSQVGAATPPGTSTPSRASSFLAVPIWLNHGSCMKIRSVSLFNQVKHG